VASTWTQPLWQELVLRRAPPFSRLCSASVLEAKNTARMKCNTFAIMALIEEEAGLGAGFGGGGGGALLLFVAALFCKNTKKNATRGLILEGRDAHERFGNDRHRRRLRFHTPSLGKHSTSLKNYQITLQSRAREGATQITCLPDAHRAVVHFRQQLALHYSVCSHRLFPREKNLRMRVGRTAHAI
jgi:hypothetical protein